MSYNDDTQRKYSAAKNITAKGQLAQGKEDDGNTSNITKKVRKEIGGVDAHQYHATAFDAARDAHKEKSKKNREDNDKDDNDNNDNDSRSSGRDSAVMSALKGNLPGSGTHNQRKREVLGDRDDKPQKQQLQTKAETQKGFESRASVYDSRERGLRGQENEGQQGTFLSNFLRGFTGNDRDSSSDRPSWMI